MRFLWVLPSRAWGNWMRNTLTFFHNCSILLCGCLLLFSFPGSCLFFCLHFFLLSPSCSFFFGREKTLAMVPSSLSGCSQCDLCQPSFPPGLIVMFVLHKPSRQSHSFHPILCLLLANLWVDQLETFCSPGLQCPPLRQSLTPIQSDPLIGTTSYTGILPS